jgi:hypothetical protein
MCASAGAQNNPQVVIFDPPGSISTFSQAINSSQTVTGTYFDAAKVAHGFVRIAQGAIATFDAVDPEGFPTLYMGPQSINDAGAIAGYFYSGHAPSCDNFTHQHSFVRAADGSIAVFDPPGAACSLALSINNGGVVVGFYRDAITYHGFVRDDRGNITSIDVPGNDFTLANAIDSGGIITGAAGLFSAPIQHGFVRDAKGTITLFDPPGSMFTFPVSIAENTIAGYYIDASGNNHGFVRTADGTITALDPPGSALTIAFGINPEGDITGLFSDAKGVTHGFLRDKHGSITSFDPPGSIETQPSGLNAAQVVTGTFRSAPHVGHGFLLKP